MHQGQVAGRSEAQVVRRHRRACTQGRLAASAGQRLGFGGLLAVVDEPDRAPGHGPRSPRQRSTSGRAAVVDDDDVNRHARAPSGTACCRLRRSRPYRRPRRPRRSAASAASAGVGSAATGVDGEPGLVQQHGGQRGLGEEAQVGPAQAAHRSVVETARGEVAHDGPVADVGRRDDRARRRDAAGGAARCQSLSRVLEVLQHVEQGHGVEVAVVRTPGPRAGSRARSGRLRAPAPRRPRRAPAPRPRHRGPVQRRVRRGLRRHRRRAGAARPRAGARACRRARGGGKRRRRARRRAAPARSAPPAAPAARPRWPRPRPVGLRRGRVEQETSRRPVHRVRPGLGGRQPVAAAGGVGLEVGARHVGRRYVARAMLGGRDAHRPASRRARAAASPSGTAGPGVTSIAGCRSPAGVAPPRLPRLPCLTHLTHLTHLTRLTPAGPAGRAAPPGLGAPLRAVVSIQALRRAPRRPAGRFNSCDARRRVRPSPVSSLSVTRSSCSVVGRRAVGRGGVVGLASRGRGGRHRVHRLQWRQWLQWLRRLQWPACPGNRSAAPPAAEIAQDDCRTGSRRPDPRWPVRTRGRWPTCARCTGGARCACTQRRRDRCLSSRRCAPPRPPARAGAEEGDLQPSALRQHRGVGQNDQRLAALKHGGRSAARRPRGRSAGRRSDGVPGPRTWPRSGR